MSPVLAIFNLGGGEILVIGLIALLLFGTRLPKVARSLGQSVNEFKQGMKDPPKEPDEKSDGSK
jgi:sec-independent protein translocase protein TatA